MKNSQLAKLQSEFQNFILGESQVLNQPIKGHLDIYKDGYLIRLKNSLYDDFTRVREQINNDDRFDEIIVEFINKNPSTYFNLAEYSFDFVYYIEKTKPQYYLDSLLDWTEISVLNSSNEDKNDTNHLLKPEEIQKTLLSDPSLKIKTSNTSKLISFNKAHFIIYKFNHDVITQPLSENEYLFYDFLSKGRTLTELEDYILTIKSNNEWSLNDYLNQIYKGFREGILCI